MVETALYKKAVDKFGKEHQLLVMAGELAECIAEIARHQIPKRKHKEELLIDEIADVVIMTNQMKVIYGDKLISAINKKLNKLEGHTNG